MPQGRREGVATLGAAACLVLVLRLLGGTVEGRQQHHQPKSKEIIYIEDGISDTHSYRLEDFFWTGSGDDALENQTAGSSGPSTIAPSSSTVYHTQTILSTVYITASGVQNDTPTEAPCCTTPHGDISPTSTQMVDLGWDPTGGGKGNVSAADRQFWLLTIFKADGSEPLVPILENSLAKLYRTAFLRQQERHLGISNRLKRETTKEEPNKPVNVHIYNLSKNEDDDSIEVLYHVTVSGQPVVAVTAASDMKLVSDEEVSKELGYPVLKKAEPYLKNVYPQSLSRTRDTWLFVGAASSAIFILLVVVCVLTLCSTKKKKLAGSANRRQVFEREDGGQVNAGYVEEGGQTKVKTSTTSKKVLSKSLLQPTYQSGKRKKGSPLARNTVSNETLNSNVSTSRRQSSSNSSLTSGSISDASPLVEARNRLSNIKNGLYYKVKRPTVKAISGTEHIIVDSSSSEISTRDDLDAPLKKAGRIPEGGIITSPKSYLSMPSVKSFPRGNMPEPLNRVLEPVSVLHLDILDDLLTEGTHQTSKNRYFVRHGSLEADDPGIIGPIVWDMHRQRLQQSSRGSLDDSGEEIRATQRMKNRFHELLDDTFSLFGTRRDDHEDEVDETEKHPKHIEVRGHSAVVSSALHYCTLAETVTICNVSDKSHVAKSQTPQPKPRPRTCDPRRILPSSGDCDKPPRGAWGSGGPSPLVRPLSAGPIRRPHIDIEHVLAEGKLPPSDPAIPLIAAIKTELNKCSLPGSTINLNE